MITGWLASASAGTTRLALLVGANDGGPDRLALRYAVQDADALRQVLVEVGGVSESDAIVLRDPDADTLRSALDAVDRRARDLTAAGERVEVVVYYSGHSDPVGLRLGGSELSFVELRSSFDALGAETGLFVLDACASGAFVRAKGGERVHPLWDDAANRAAGRAILTSSAATEASQESDVIEGSFFTTALTAGLRGAADRDGDRRVTLTEAYDYAYDATRFATAGTLSGIQHPEREVQLVGAGDLVLTDLRRPSAALELDPALAGRLFVRDDSGELVLEVAKDQGTPMRLLLPAGALTWTLESADAEYGGQVRLQPGLAAALGPKDLDRVALQATRWRGGERKHAPAGLWITTGVLAALSTASGLVAVASSGGAPWYADPTPLSRASGATFVVTGGLGSALLIGLTVDELGRSR